MEQAHVFICYGSLSLDAAIRIAENQGLANSAYFLLLFPGKRDDIPKGTQLFVMDPGPETYSEWVKPFAIARWFARSLRALDAAPISSIVAYLPHPFELPANHFFFTDPRVERVELLPDGLINYMHRTLYPESAQKMLRYGTRVLLRILAARACGLHYRPYARGHITQYERGIYQRAWGYARKGYLTGSPMFEQLPPSRAAASMKAASSGHTVLVLDQELHQIVRPDLEAALREALMSQLVALQPEVILYKQHPRGLNRRDSFEASGLVARDVSGPELAEHLVHAHGVDVLLGFYSTPLVLMADAVPRRIAIMPPGAHGGVLQPRHVDQIVKALVSSEAEVIRVPDAALLPRT